MRARRLAALGAAAAALATMGSARGQTGDSAPITAKAAAWYGASATAPLGTVTIAAGDLPVGRGVQAEDKRSYLAVEVPAGAQSGTITLGRSSSTGTTYGQTGAVAVCPATEPWTSTANGDLSQAPGFDCTGGLAVAGTVDGEGRYQFDVSPILAAWSTGMANNGLAFLAVGGNLWQMTFSVTLDDQVGTATVAPSAPADEPFAFDEEESFQPVVVTPAPLPDLLPTVDVPAASPIAAPSTPAAPVAPTAAARPVRALKALPVNAAVWLVIPLGLVALYAVARALGRDGEPRSELERLLAG